MRWARYVARIGENGNAFKMLVGKPEGKRPLTRSRHKWDNIKMDIKEIGWERVDWGHLAQDRDSGRLL
jgi:hypothetical protein